MVRAVERQEPGLEGDEGDGVRGPDGATQHAAGVGIQSARHVEREDRAGQAIDALDHRGVVAGELAREADAEQAVDDERPGAFADLRRLGRERNPEEPLLEPLGDHARVAAVVARAGEDQHVLGLL